MPSFLSNLKKLLSTRASFDAEIIGDAKLRANNTPFFTIKMRGCNTLVDINAEDIIEKFTEKFHQTDIKNAAKVFMKYRKLLKLVSFEKHFAILHSAQNDSYQLADLSDSLCLNNIDLDLLRAEDAFKLGVHFEKVRFEKDRKLFHLTKSASNLAQFTVVSPHDE